MHFLSDYRIDFASQGSKSEAWLKFGHVARNFTLYKQMLMGCFKIRKKSRLKNQDMERT